VLEIRACRIQMFRRWGGIETSFCNVASMRPMNGARAMVPTRTSTSCQSGCAVSQLSTEASIRSSEEHQPMYAGLLGIFQKILKVDFWERRF
jgi:hypothetical protein